MRDVVWSDPHHGLFFGNQALFDHVSRDLDGGRTGSLATPRLQHVQLAAFDGEFNVLHVAVVLLQLGANFQQFLVGFGIPFGHVLHGLRGPNARHHIFALGVDQEFTVELVLPSGWVAGKCNPGAGVVASVAEHHGLHVDRGAIESGDAFDPAIRQSLVPVPALEDGFDGGFQLPHGVLGERFTNMLSVNLFVQVAKLSETCSINIGVFLHLQLLLQPLKGLFEVVVIHIHHHITKHIDETAVGVKGESFACRFGHGRNGVVVESKIENRVHHARHGDGRARANRKQQWVAAITKLLARFFFQGLDGFGHLIHQSRRHLGPVLVVRGTGIGGDGHAWRDRKANRSHVGQIGTFATQQSALIGPSIDFRATEVIHHARGTAGTGGGLFLL